MPFGQPKQVKLILPPLHPAQREFAEAPARFVVATCGSKFGKTFCCSLLMLRHAWNNYQSRVRWAAPSYRQANMARDTIIRMLPKHRYRLSRAENVIELLRTNGDVHATLFFNSADNPDGLRGEAINLLICDEGAFWSQEAFIAAFTTLTRTKGIARIVSTPKGKNAFFDLYQKGNPDNPLRDPDWASFRYPTWVNPYIDADAIESFRRAMPRDAFRQEIEAEFLDDGAGVFRNLRACQTAPWLSGPQRGAQYVVGLDLAKHQDYSVMLIADRATKEVVWVSRSQDVDWQVQVDMAIRTAKHWNSAQICMDSTGLGDVVYDSIRGAYPHVTPYNISNNAQKTALIQKLQFAFENGDIAIPLKTVHVNAAALVQELEYYSFELSVTGKFLYRAPEGYHDDCVIACALANWLLQEDVKVYRARSLRGF